LSPVSWQTVSVSPVTSNGTSTVTMPATNAIAYFRLAQ
jgi:hypothetical protein